MKLHKGVKRSGCPFWKKRNTKVFRAVMFYFIRFFGALILIILCLKKIKYKVKIFLIMVCLSIIFFGAVSRVYLGVHWFKDVLGGFIPGVFCVLMMGYFYVKNDTKVSGNIN